MVSTLASFRKEISEYKEKLEQLQQALDQSDQQAETQRSRLESLQKEKRKVDRTVENQRQQLDQLSKERKELEQKKDSHLEELELLKEEQRETILLWQEEKKRAKRNEVLYRQLSGDGVENLSIAEFEMLSKQQKNGMMKLEVAFDKVRSFPILYK